MTRHKLAILPLVLLGACSSVEMPYIGPHRIDVQQGNALDQESVAKLKPGLNHSQVRFLLGTPLLVDPFHTDRWDYVYTFYKSGKLAEQKRITLFFEGDILKRIEGDLPAPQPVVQSESPKTVPATTVPLPQKPEPATAASPPAASPIATPVAGTQAAVLPTPTAAPTPPVAPTPSSAPAQPAPLAATSVVPPLPSPKGATAYVDQRPPVEGGLQVETNVAQIQPDVIPPFPEPNAPAAGSPAAINNEESVLQAVKAWSEAWRQRDEDAYLAAYAPDFVPPGGGTRAAWEKRRRLLLDVAKKIELKIDSPSVELAPDGNAIVTFNQFYRSDSYRDAVVKQLKLALRDGRWLIIEERVLSILHSKKR